MNEMQKIKQDCKDFTEFLRKKYNLDSVTIICEMEHGTLVQHGAGNNDLFGGLVSAVSAIAGVLGGACEENETDDGVSFNIKNRMN